MAARPGVASKRLSPLGIAAAGAGLLLFWWALRRTGLAPVTDGIRRVGAGFLVILVLAGLRFWLRAWAWAVATAAPGRLGVRETFPAFVAGDALGNLTPLGLFVSEPVKAAIVRRRVSTMEALAGIAVENLAYTVSVFLIIAAGMVALLFEFQTGVLVRQIAIAALGVIFAALLAGTVVLLRQIKIVSGALHWLERRGRAPDRLARRLGKLRELEDLIYGFAGRSPRRVATLVALELTFHVFGVAEIWYTLGLLLGAAAPGPLTTFVLESVNRTITVAFKFVPLRLGVDELGTELLTRTLGLPLGIGVTMAIVRKARVLAWSAIGVVLLVRLGLSPTALAGAEGGNSIGSVPKTPSASNPSRPPSVT